MKHFIKIVMILALATISASCCSQKELTSHVPEAIQEVYFQKWIGGQEFSPSGTNLHLTFEKPLPSDTFLQKAFFQNQEADFEKLSETIYVAHFYDKSTAKDVILDGRTEKEYGNEPPKDKREMPDFPYDLKPTEAVLEFHIHNKASHVKIINIKEKEVMAFPSARTDKN